MPASVSRVPFLAKVAYGTGHILNDMCASMWFTYLLIFFHKVLGFGHVVAGALLTIGQFADGLSTLFVGFFSDRGSNFGFCNRYGKRKSWHLLGTICVLFSFAFIFSPCVHCKSASEEDQMVYYSAFIIIFQFGWASVQISHLAMIPDLTSCQNENTVLTSVRYAATIASTIVVYAVLWLYLGTGKSSQSIDSSDAYIFRNAALICLGVGGLASLIFHLTVKHESGVGNAENVAEISAENIQEKSDCSDTEQNISTPSKTIVINTENSSVYQSMTIKDWFYEPQFYQIGCVYMFTRLFVNSTQVFMPFYLQVTLKLKAMYVAVIPLVMYLSGMVVAFVMNSVTKCLGKKTAYAVSCVVGGTGCLWIHWGCEWNSDFTGKEIFIVAVLIGSGGAAMLITSLSITADFIGKDKKSSAFLYGAMSLLDKMSNGIAIMLIQQFVPTNIDDCPLCRHYYNNVLVWVCGSFTLAGLVAIISLAPTAIGKRRKYSKQGKIDDRPILILDINAERNNHL